MGKRLWLLAGAVILASTIVVSGATAKSDGVSAKSQKTVLVFGAEQDIACFNTNLEGCNQFWAVVIAGTPVLRPAFMITPKLQYRPDLITSGKASLKGGFHVTYNIKKKANWADGTQVTGQDFLWSAQKIVDPKSQVSGRDGYDQMIFGKTKITNRGKSVTFYFKAPYAAWKDLFSPGVVLPKHILQSEDYNQILPNCVCNPKNGKPFSNGPYILQSYRKGTDATLVRNDKWYGPKAKLARIVFRFIQDTNTEIQAMRGGEVDAIFPSPQTALTALQRQSGISYKSAPGLYNEHIDLSGKGKHNSLMEKVWFRQAIIRGINRPGLIKTFFGDIAPTLKVSNNLVLYPSDANYKQDFARYSYNPTAAKRLLTSHGCRAGGDGIMTCGGVKAELTHTTTGTNRRRVLAAQVYKENLKEIGIDINIRLVPPNVLFGDGPESTAQGNWDMAEYAWVTSPDPSYTVAWLKCKGESNNTTYCNRRASRLLERSDKTLNARARAKLFVQADKIMSADVPVIPLYAVPVIYVHKNAAKALGAPNPSSWGPTWNSHLWKF